MNLDPRSICWYFDSNTIKLRATKNTEFQSRIANGLLETKEQPFCLKVNVFCLFVCFFLYAGHKLEAYLE